MTGISLPCAAKRVATRASVFLMVCVMTACTGAAPPARSGASSTAAPTETSAPRPSALVTPKPTHRTAIIDNFDAGGPGWAMTKAGGALWIQVDPPVDAIVRIDAETGSATPAVPGGQKAKSGPEGLWVLGGDWLVRLDPAAGTESLRVPMGGAFALGEGAVWLLNSSGLHRIDPETGAVDKPIAVRGDPACGTMKDLTVAFDSAWVACKEGHVVRIDLGTGDATNIPTAAGAHTFAVTKEGVWVTNYQAGSVSRIDPETNEVTTIAGAGSGVGITTGDGYVWAATPIGIAKIDPGTATIEDTIAIGLGEYYELVWDDGVIWASTRGDRVLKVDVSGSTP